MLNRIWGGKCERLIKAFSKKRLVAFMMVLGAGLVLFLFMIGGGLISALDDLLGKVSIEAPA